MASRVVVNRAAIHRLLRDPSGPTGQWLDRQGESLAAEAARHAPVDTGALRGSITANQVRPQAAVRLSVTVGSNLRYARYVELGTRYARAQPYLRPALRSWTLRGGGR